MHPLGELAQGMPTQEVTSSPPVVGEGMAPPTEQQQVLLAVLTGGRCAAVPCGFCRLVAQQLLLLQTRYA